MQQEVKTRTRVAMHSIRVGQAPVHIRSVKPSVENEKKAGDTAS